MYRGSTWGGMRYGMRTIPIATRTVPYKMPNKSYRGTVISGVGADEYYGPPRPGQSWSQYESFMQMPIAASIGGVIIGAVLGGPIGAIAMGLGGWALGSGIQQKKKSLTQGG